MTLHKNMKLSIKDFFSKCDQIAVSCGFGHIYWKELYWKTLFFVQCDFEQVNAGCKTRWICELENQHYILSETSLKTLKNAQKDIWAFLNCRMKLHEKRKNTRWLFSFFISIIIPPPKKISFSQAFFFFVSCPYFVLF